MNKGRRADDKMIRVPANVWARLVAYRNRLLQTVLVRNDKARAWFTPSLADAIVELLNEVGRAKRPSKGRGRNNDKA